MRLSGGMFKWLFGKKDDAAEVGGTAELIVVNRRIGLPVDRAFSLFVDELNTWWPRDLTWAKDRLAEVGIEPKIGGHAYERDKDGAVSTWGTVLSLRRPEHIVLAWQIRPDRTPEPSGGAASRVDARFVSVDPNTTDLVLVHRDFPRHGDGWQGYRAGMAGKSGWPRLIEAYAKAAGG
jgi:uncharacterized protein YndB with AHSA1/START domain